MDIRDSYPKTAEVFSLKTKDHAEALVRLAAVEVDQRFEAHRRMIALERASLVDELSALQRRLAL
ncbi:DUF6538 domain-containing protein [Paracoccus sp. N5]|uniref:DUF6538 domain-containing protein n=1 Tax=Paracoccus sp. N5 TaxID=1101189 RepID=UPI0003754306|nr:DUF6538 domain-containing protein [Paracoccus sp. N5]